MTEERHLTCIECPLGCSLVTISSSNHIIVTGNRCPRGERYAVQELEHPTRMLTTTIGMDNGNYPLLPVRSKHPLPKHLVKDCVCLLAHIRVRAPVQMGEVVYSDIAHTGIDVIATRTMEAAHA